MKLKNVLLIVGLLALLTAVGYGLTAWVMGNKSQQASSQLDQALASFNENPPLAEGDYAVGDRLAQGDAAAPASFDPAYPELEWDRLMPADWDPMAAFRGLNIAELQDNDPRAQQALNAMREAWNKAPVNTDLSGKKVRIPGFVIPVEQSEAGVAELLLVPYFGACIHTPPPPANQIVHVKLSNPQPAIGAMQAYWVWGELKLNRFSSEFGEAAYQLIATGVQPYDQ
ncbi:MAG TPA: DUF3299 domain-containing protein [Limnobacter sp.]|nr:DUF3299 domain-containing protein [Limnobacter sp.]